MRVTVDVAGGDSEAVSVDDDATYGDLLERVDQDPQRTAVLVDGTPVPADATVDADRVRVVRLIKGG